MVVRLCSIAPDKTSHSYHTHIYCAYTYLFFQLLIPQLLLHEEGRMASYISESFNRECQPGYAYIKFLVSVSAKVLEILSILLEDVIVDREEETAKFFMIRYEIR